MTNVCEENVPTFPQRIMALLEDEDIEQQCMHWLPSGRAFRIFDVGRFEEIVLKAHFNSIKMESFVVRLSKWGFVRMDQKCHTRYVSHTFASELFRRDMPELCKSMKLTNKKGRKKPTKALQSVFDPSIKVSPPSSPLSSPSPRPRPSRLKESPLTIVKRMFQPEPEESGPVLQPEPEESRPVFKPRPEESRVVFKPMPQRHPVNQMPTFIPHLVQPIQAPPAYPQPPVHPIQAPPAYPPPPQHYQHWQIPHGHDHMHHLPPQYIQPPAQPQMPYYQRGHNGQFSPPILHQPRGVPTIHQQFVPQPKTEGQTNTRKRFKAEPKMKKVKPIGEVATHFKTDYHQKAEAAVAMMDLAFSAQGQEVMTE